MIVLIDNYDSFTYNLYQYLGEIRPNIRVVRNDASVCEIEAMRPDRIVLSPGPGHPRDAGVCVELIRRVSGRIPLLGICLGHQAVSLAFGGRVDYAPQIVHGKASQIYHDGTGLFRGLPPRFLAGRYHSLAVPEDGLPDCLEVTARTADGVVMAVAHRAHPTYGLQFHPESILTGCGRLILENFLLEGGEAI
jgi:anthranilate synthase/aminodeoxychorismate synthase-like glutamine amidotransferase